MKTNKMFLGGLDPSTSKEDIKEAFMEQGKIVSIEIMTEKETEKPRGFGFVTFDDTDTVENLCMIKHFVIKVSLQIMPTLFNAIFKLSLFQGTRDFTKCLRY